MWKLRFVTDEEFAGLEAELFDDFPLPLQGPHGPRHWRRVDRYARLLALRNGADLAVVRRFALFHDCQRFSEGQDPGHGRRGAEWAQRYCSHELNPEQMQWLVLACEGHEMGLCSDHPTIGACWDADRLDLERSGIDPSPLYMSTAYGRELAAMSLGQRHFMAGLLPFWQGIDSLEHPWDPR